MIVATLPYVQKIIVCDDGSRDMTATIAEALGAEVIRHYKNSGYGASLRSLFKAAHKINADIMVTLDADGQHDPSFIPALISPIVRRETDIVIGSRFIGKGGKEKIPGYRQKGIKIINALAKSASYSNITDTQSGLRAYSWHAIEVLCPSEFGMGASTEILIKAKENHLNVCEVPAIITYDEGSSTKNPIHHGGEVIASTIKQMSIKKPMLFYGIPGITFIMLGVAFGFWGIELFARSHVLSANIVIIAIGLVIFGLLFMSTAVILWVLVSLIREKV